MIIQLCVWMKSLLSRLCILYLFAYEDFPSRGDKDSQPWVTLAERLPCTLPPIREKAKLLVEQNLQDLEKKFLMKLLDAEDRPWFHHLLLKGMQDLQNSQDSSNVALD
mgnify:CR=1 FL=1